MPAPAKMSRAGERQGRIAGVADARDPEADVAVGSRADAQVQVATRQHFERARAADLDVAGRGAAAGTEPGFRPKFGIQVVSDQIAARLDHRRCHPAGRSAHKTRCR